jgi:hypothetical protein
MPDPIPANRNVGPQQPTARNPARPPQRPRRGLTPGWLVTIGALVSVVIIVAANNQTGSTPQSGDVPAPTETYSAATDNQPTDTQTDPGDAAQPTSSPTPTAVGVVELGQNVQADPRAVAVGTMLDTYFSGIDSGDYTSALSVEDPAGALNPANASEVQAFEQGVQTTDDGQVILVSLAPADTTSSATSAIVTFRSTQQAGYGPSDDPNETCTDWSLTCALTADSDGSYLIHSVESASDEGC